MSAFPRPTSPQSPGWLARMLSWVVAGSFGLTALFSALTAWHFHREIRMMKIELEDLAAEKHQLKKDMLGEREVLVREIEDMQETQAQVDSLISKLNGTKAPPESGEDLARELARIRGLVQGKPLSEAEKQEILTTLRHLLATPASALEKNQGASAVLHSLADVAMIDRAQIPAMLAVLRGEPRPSTLAPPGSAPPAVPPAAPPPVVVEPAAPQSEARIAVPADPLARQEPLPPPPETPPPPPKPKAPGQQVRQEKGAFEVTFPEGWTVRDKELATGVMALSPKFADFPLERAYVLVNASDLLDQQVLAEFAGQQSRQVTQTLVNARRVTEGDLQINGRPARFVFFAHDQNGRSFLTMYLFTVTAEKGYMLTFSARNDLYPRMEKAFNDIAGSFMAGPAGGKKVNE